MVNTSYIFKNIKGYKVNNSNKDELYNLFYITFRPTMVDDEPILRLDEFKKEVDINKIIKHIEVYNQRRIAYAEHFKLKGLDREYTPFDYVLDTDVEDLFKR
jgi:hypothetical protein